MPVATPTKGHKKAARRAAKKQALTAEKASSSCMEYILVGTIPPERFDTPVVSTTPIDNSAASASTVREVKPPSSNSGPTIAITIPSSAPSMSQQLWLSSTNPSPPQSPGTLPVLRAPRLESLDSFNDGFTFTASTLTEDSKSFDVSNAENTSSAAFSKEFVDELSRAKPMTTAVPRKAIEATLSQTSNVQEPTIFTRLRPVVLPDASTSVYIPKHTSTAVEKQQQQQECSLIPARSSFGSRRSQRHVMQPRVAECVETAAFHTLMTNLPTNAISAHVAKCTHTEATHLYLMQPHVASKYSVETRVVSSPSFADLTIGPLQLETRSIRQPSYAEYAQEQWAIVPYCDCHSVETLTDCEIEKEIPSKRDTTLSLERTLNSRIFVARGDGTIQCIHNDQLLHDIETTQDDGSSDFDSVASPDKKDLRHIDSRGRHFWGSDKPSEFDHHDLIVQLNGTLLTSAEDTDAVHGWCLSPMHGYTLQEEELLVHANDSGLGSKDAVPVSTEECVHVVMPPSDSQSSTSPDSKRGAQDGCRDESEDATFIAGFVAEAEIPAKVTSTSSETSDASDWACELCRMCLGTESLFTYLKILEVEDSGNATRDAVVAAYLYLIGLERKKSRVHFLPPSCTAYSVLSSGILPHTIMLGTTTVASFVAQLSFDGKDEVKIVDLYAAWDRLGREEMRQKQVASVGIMGALGRTLGRLA